MTTTPNIPAELQDHLCRHEDAEGDAEMIRIMDVYNASLIEFFNVAGFVPNDNEKFWMTEAAMHEAFTGAA